MTKHKCDTPLCYGAKHRILGYRTLCEYYDNDHKVFNAYKDESVKPTPDNTPIMLRRHPQLTPWYKRLWHFVFGYRLSKDNFE